MSVDGIPKPVMSIYIPLSLNFLSSFDACLPYKITHLSNIVISFDNHKKLYTSQTNNMDLQKKQEFDNHKKLHTYQTVS